MKLWLVSALLVIVGSGWGQVAYSRYNWVVSPGGVAQTANPGAYLRVGFTGNKISVKVDVSPLTKAHVEVAQYPMVRFSIDNGPPQTLQLTPSTTTIPCASGLASGEHSLLLQYVAGYVFLDFWTPVNVLRITGFELAYGSALVEHTPSKRHLLFLGDSITNGDDDIAKFEGGITNSVDTQDANIGYPSVVATALGAEYGVVAYGGASWDHTAADGHTPGLMASWSMLDSVHSRLTGGKLTPAPDAVFVNMGENSGPADGDVVKLLTELRSASGSGANIFVIIPFSGRSREALKAGVAAYRASAAQDKSVFVLDLGNNPYLTNAGATLHSVDGQHPLATLHGLLGAQLVNAIAQALR